MSRLEKALKISIINYLEERGIPYERQSGSNYYYYSPFKSENVPSFCVNTSKKKKDVWKDFATGEKLGDIIDLVQKLDKVSTSEAISIILNDDSGHEDRFVKRDKKVEPQILISDPSELTSGYLLEYITRRKVSKEVAVHYCKQVYVTFPSRHPDKQHKCLAFVNKKGGYELRNSYLKVSTSPKIFTEVDGFSGESVIELWEGFIDFLSYLSYNNWVQPKYNTIILNGLCNIPYIDISKNSLWHIYLDNDLPAEKEFVKLKPLIRYEDRRKLFEGYKDFNQAEADDFQKTKIISRARESVRRFCVG